MALSLRDRWAPLALVAGTMLVVAGIVWAASDGASTTSRVPVPAIETPQGERCVEDTAFMRRNHMALLRHQRDKTVHEGIRTLRHSLNNCVACHASKATGRVTGEGGFCESCHRYASVKLDCFECHADRPEKVAGTKP